jgi:hypothetical protein
MASCVAPAFDPPLVDHLTLVFLFSGVPIATVIGTATSWHRLHSLLTNDG